MTHRGIQQYPAILPIIISDSKWLRLPTTTHVAAFAKSLVTSSFSIPSLLFINSSFSWPLDCEISYVRLISAPERLNPQFVSTCSAFQLADNDICIASTIMIAGIGPQERLLVARASSTGLAVLELRYLILAQRIEIAPDVII